jgi:hypothetical protein
MPHAGLLQMLAQEGASLRIVGVAGSPVAACRRRAAATRAAGPRGQAPPARAWPGRGVFMEELLAELERRGVAFAADEAGKKEGNGGGS